MVVTVTVVFEVLRSDLPLSQCMVISAHMSHHNERVPTLPRTYRLAWTLHY